MKNSAAGHPSPGIPKTSEIRVAPKTCADQTKPRPVVRFVSACRRKVTDLLTQNTLRHGRQRVDTSRHRKPILEGPAGSGAILGKRAGRLLLEGTVPRPKKSRRAFQIRKLIAGLFRARTFSATRNAHAGRSVRPGSLGDGRRIAIRRTASAFCSSREYLE